MKARGRLALLACGLAAVLALPAAASAKPGYYAIKPSHLSAISLKGSNGYSIDVFALNSSQISILASDTTPAGPSLPPASFSATVSSASYNVRGKATRERIEGRFGSRGRVSVRFAPKGRPKVEEIPKSCEGRPSVTIGGQFVGTIRFEGEGGFTRVRAARANGFVSQGHRLVCKRPERKNQSRQSQPPPATSLSALSGRRPDVSLFSVYKEGPRLKSRGRSSAEEANYSGSTTEKREGMTIVRSASVLAPPETFAVSPLGTSPVTATVSPPAPFSGTASYEKDATGKVTWSGDLAVELPGRGGVTLVGPTYRAKLCRSFACACPLGPCLFASIGTVAARPASTAAAPTPSPWRWPGSPR